MKLKLYRWKAKNRLNQTQKGMLVAESEDQATQNLFKRGFQHIHLQRNWQLSSRPKNAEICELLQQLATLLNASVPLKNALHILLQNCINIPLNQWLRRCITDIESGLSFSQTLEYQSVFLTFQERQLIKVGEITGKLAAVCTQIANHKQQALKLQRKIQKILLYPVMVLGVSLLLTLLLLIFIVPQFAEMYGENQAQLPTFTAILLNLSNSLRHYFWLLVVLFICIILMLKYQLRHSSKLNTYKSKLISNTPILGNITQLARLIRFCNGMQLMLQSGIPLTQALQSFLPQRKSWQTSVSWQSDPILIQEVEAILHWTTQGYSFSASVGSRLFPLQAQQMLQVGEQAGQLSNILKHIAENYQQQLDHQIDLLSQLLEPLLMVIIGSLIGLIMLGMYLPIFNMGSLIQ